jgi:outer membrane protein assembly factor BamB/orotate phosphoribosyltransferase
MDSRIADLQQAIRSHVFVQSKDGVRIIDGNETTRAEWLFDFRAIMLQPQWLDLYAELFWERYADRYPFQVCAMESAGISLVAAIVMKGVARGTPVNGFFVRKSRKRTGLLKQIEGMPTKDPAIVVDDLINGGNTFSKLVKIVTEAGISVSDIFSILAFREKVAYKALTEKGVRLESLFTITDFGIPLLSSNSPAVIQGEAFKTIWHFRAPNPTYNFVVQKSAPIIDDERVYFGTDSGTFYALYQESGAIAWTFSAQREPAGKGIFSSPALHNGLVYFGAYDGNVYVLEAATGKKRWQFSDADWIGSSPSLAPKLNLLFIGLEFGLWHKRGGIAAIRMDTGALVWKNIHPELTHGSPLYIEEEQLVVIGSNDAAVYAYAAQTGELVWRFAADASVKSSFAYDPKRRLVLFGGLGATFYALSATTGEPVFANELNSGLYSTPLVEGDQVYFSSLDKNIYAVNLDTGKECWKFGTSGRIFASPIIAEHSLWCSSNDGRLYEINMRTGKKIGSFQATERIVNKIAYQERTRRFFVPTQTNELYCLERNTGSAIDKSLEINE